MRTKVVLSHITPKRSIDLQLLFQKYELSIVDEELNKLSVQYVTEKPVEALGLTNKLSNKSLFNLALTHIRCLICYMYSEKYHLFKQCAKTCTCDQATTPEKEDIALQELKQLKTLSPDLQTIVFERYVDQSRP